LTTTATAPRKRLAWQTPILEAGAKVVTVCYGDSRCRSRVYDRPRSVSDWVLSAHTEEEAQGNHEGMVVMRQAAREEGGA
jgi:hypothetical protein